MVDEATVHKLHCLFTFEAYTQCIKFAVQVAELAEIENHHPDLYIQWGKVTVTWWTHSIQGLHQNDLIMAAKTTTLSC